MAQTSAQAKESILEYKRKLNNPQEFKRKQSFKKNNEPGTTILESETRIKTLGANQNRMAPSREDVKAVNLS